MPVIIPLHNAGGRCVAPSVNGGDASRVGVVGKGDDREACMRVMDDLVSFLCNKGDKRMMANFQSILSDYSRANGHIFDAQLERMDEWQMDEKMRNEEMYRSVIKRLVESNIDVHGNYYNVHDNKIEK